MADVTFIIGNGFDLSLGMQTSYRDFYEHVKSKRLHPDNRIYKAIQESPESWADFELSLGQYTNYIDSMSEKDRKQESVKFHEELNDLMDDLADYLAGEENHVQINGDIRLTKDGFFAELPIGQRERVSSLLVNSTNFRFISLNYTNTLEALLSDSRVGLANRRVIVDTPPARSRRPV